MQKQIWMMEGRTGFIGRLGDGNNLLLPTP